MVEIKELLYEISSCNRGLLCIENALGDSPAADLLRQMRLRESALLDQIDKIIH